MKKFKVCAVLLMALLGMTGCSQRNYPTHGSHIPDGEKVRKVVAALHDPNSRYVVVVAHRGDWRNYPENSLEAIESVIRMGVDVMELDLKMTRDSVLVLCHDWTIDRTTTGSGAVSDFKFAELQRFDLKRGHGIGKPGVKMPSLRQALELCRGRIVVNVDQGYDYYDKVLALTEELGMTEQVLIKSGRPREEVEKRLAQYPRNMMYMPVVTIRNRATCRSSTAMPTPRSHRWRSNCVSARCQGA